MAVSEFLVNLAPIGIGLLAAVAILLAVFTLWLALARTSQLRANQLQMAAELALLEKKTATMISGSLGMGQRLMALEKKLKQVSEKRTTYTATEADFSYSQAHSLIDQGVDADTVAANTGLSPSEIELMALLHKTPRAAGYE